MTREEASFYLSNIDRRTLEEETNEALDMAIKALEQKPKWISISERLPEEYIACLCTIRNHETFNNRLEVYDHVIQYDPDSKEWLDEDMSRLDYEVIAWMPLPEPYKAGSEV